MISFSSFAPVSSAMMVLAILKVDAGTIRMAEAAAQGAGVALLPVAMFERELSAGRLVRAFDEKVAMGDYWLTSLKSKVETDAMRAFRRWIVAAAAGSSRIHDRHESRTAFDQGQSGRVRRAFCATTFLSTRTA
jgi:hypothetical protein